MTAQKVDGRTVIADEPAVSPYLKDATGRPVEWRQIRRLLLDDGSECFGCQHCDYTSSNMNSIRPHLAAHNSNKPPKRSRRNGETAPDGVGLGDLVDLLRRLENLDKVCRERDDWKARAVTAERYLATLRKALGGAAGRE